MEWLDPKTGRLMVANVEQKITSGLAVEQAYATETCRTSLFACKRVSAATQRSRDRVWMIRPVRRRSRAECAHSDRAAERANAVRDHRQRITLRRDSENGIRIETPIATQHLDPSDCVGWRSWSLVRTPVSFFSSVQAALTRETSSRITRAIRSGCSRDAK